MGTGSVSEALLALKVAGLRTLYFGLLQKAAPAPRLLP
jgi:hypothetical protein